MHTCRTLVTVHHFCFDDKYHRHDFRTDAFKKVGHESGATAGCSRQRVPVSGTQNLDAPVLPGRAICLAEGPGFLVQAPLHSQP
jgi:hypothetical protein